MLHLICEIRPVTKGRRGGAKSPAKCVGHSLKNLGPSQKTLRPPGFPRWLRTYAKVRIKHLEITNKIDFHKYRAQYKLHSCTGVWNMYSYDFETFSVFMRIDHIEGLLNTPLTVWRRHCSRKMTELIKRSHKMQHHYQVV